MPTRPPHIRRPREEAAVDWRQFSALLVASIKLDLRSSRSKLGRRRISPYAIAIVTFVVMGVFLAVALLSKSDAFVYSLFTLSAAMFMTSLTVIMEYGTVVVSPDDFDIVAHRPVSSRTYFLAKVGNVLVYVTVTAAALAGPAAILGGPRFGGAAFGAAYMLAAIVACGATAAFAILIYSIALKAVGYERFTSAITYVHAVATVALTLGYVFLPRMLAGDASMLSLERGNWVFLAPPAWFAGAIELMSGPHGRQDVFLALAAAGSAAALGVAAAGTISLEYSRRIAELASTAEQPRRSGARRRVSDALARVGGLVCRSDGERAGFDLMALAMRRDKKLRARIYPAFGLPIAAYLYGLLTGDLRRPFIAPDPRSPIAIREILAFYSVFLSFFFASAMSQSEQWKASWIFYTAPLPDRGQLVTGARKLVFFGYIVPFFVVLFVLLAFAMRPSDAAAFALIVFLVARLAFALLSFAVMVPPLSQPPEKTRQARQLAIVMLLGGAMAVLIAVQRSVAEAPGSVILVIAGLGVLAVIAERILAARLTKTLAMQEFAG